MKNANRWVAAIVSCAILTGAVHALAQDWPQWRGPNRDDKVTGFAAPQAWPKTLTQKWKVTVGQDDSTPALVGDKLYVFARQDADEVTLCLDAKDGNVIWQNKYPAQAISGPSANAHSGPRSSPAVMDGKVITLGISGVLSCLDAKDGNVLWRKEDVKGAPTFFTAMSPIVVDGLVIAQLGGGDNGMIVAYDLAKGEKKWEWKGEGPCYASPVLLTEGGVKQIVTLTDKSVMAVGAADGNFLWKIPFAPTGRMGYNAATPIVDGSTLIYTGQGRGTTAVKVEKKDGAFATTKVWSNDKLDTQFNTPVLKDGMLYGFTGGGKLFCLSAKDGTEVWTDAASRSRQGFGAIVDVGPALLALPDSGDLLVYKPATKQYDELAKYKVGMGTFAHPVIAGNRIFVKDKDSLTLWTLE